jgi:hypothetical protein
MWSNKHIENAKKKNPWEKEISALEVHKIKSQKAELASLGLSTFNESFSVPLPFFPCPTTHKSCLYGDEHLPEAQQPYLLVKQDLLNEWAGRQEEERELPWDRPVDTYVSLHFVSYDVHDGVTQAQKGGNCFLRRDLCAPKWA